MIISTSQAFFYLQSFFVLFDVDPKIYNISLSLSTHYIYFIFHFQLFFLFCNFQNWMLYCTIFIHNLSMSQLVISYLNQQFDIILNNFLNPLFCCFFFYVKLISQNNLIKPGCFKILKLNKFSYSPKEFWHGYNFLPLASPSSNLNESIW